MAGDKDMLRMLQAEAQAETVLYITCRRCGKRALVVTEDDGPYADDYPKLAVIAVSEGWGIVEEEHPLCGWCYGASLEQLDTEEE